MCPGFWRLTELGPGLWHATVTTWPDLARTNKLWHFDRSCVVILAKKFWTPVKLAHLAVWELFPEVCRQRVDDLAAVAASWLPADQPASGGRSITGRSAA
jgi:hypothetical protein